LIVYIAEKTRTGKREQRPSRDHLDNDADPGGKKLSRHLSKHSTKRPLEDCG